MTTGLWAGNTGLWAGFSGFSEGGGLWGQFAPNALFTANEPGVWYDPSDLTTLFQDTAGTTPVTAPGQNVALMLDKSRGAPGALGAEVIPTDYTTAFVPSTNIVVNPTSIVATNANTEAAAAGSLIINGNWYRINFTVAVSSGAGPTLRFGSGGINDVSNIPSGTYSYYLNADGVAIQFRALSLGSWTVTNISVREIPGNHATQATLAQRPTYGVVPATGRRNLLTFTEQFDNAAWVKSDATVTANAAVAPDGTMTAERATPSSASPIVRQTHTTSITGAYTGTVWIKSSSSTNVTISLRPTGAGSPVSVVCAVTSTWQRFTVNLTAVAGLTNIQLWIEGFSQAIDIWGAQLETGSTATAYQRVTTAFNVTEQNVPTMHYLSFDGSDDGMVTSAINFSARDEMTVFAGLRKSSDAARGTVVELTASAASNNGAFHLTAPNAASDTFAFESKGTTLTDAIATGFAAPTTRVLTGASDISADANIIRVNGVQADSDTGDQGTGNFANAGLFIGRRGGTTLPFNGQLFGLIVRGATTDASQITQTERYIGQRVAPTVTI